MVSPTFKVKLERIDGMQFKTTFDFEHFPELMFDEPETVPTGRNEYPNASRILAASVGNCLSASLSFCLEKSRVPLDGLVTEVTGEIARADSGFWRVKKIDVDIKAKYNELDDVTRKKFNRCKEMFFNYCIVSASIKDGIEINVNTELEE
ncbi:MAG: OsmC family protein [Candidatus Heimdallarchaeota archaeon]|nr:OsmC family protein [Candidatus Heimdallarchaeota archaeon]